MSAAPIRGAAAVDRIAAIDVLRGIAIASVVMRHVSWRLLTPAALAAPGGACIAAAYIASDLGVPLFLSLSAFALAWRHSEPFGDLRGVAAFLSSRASRLLPAYVLWSLVSLAARDLSLLASPRGVGEALLFGTADVQFYFVPMVFELYLLWPLLRPVLASRTRLGAGLVLAGGSAIADLAWRGILPSPWTPLLFLSTAVCAGAGLPLLVGAGESLVARPFGRRVDARALLLALGLVVLGGVAYEQCVSRFLSDSPGSASRGALLMIAMLSARPQAVYATSLTAALAIVAAPIAGTRGGACLAALGRSSFGIFLIHLLVASTFVNRVFGGEGPAAVGAPAAVARLFAIWIVTLLVSYAFAALLERSRYLRWTMGSR